MNELGIYIDSNVELCDERTALLALRLGYGVLVCKKITGTISGRTPKLYRKIIIDSDSVQNLKKQLHSLTCSNCFITLLPRSIEVARWASHDTRIDSIMLTPDNIDLFDKKQFNIMSYYGKPLEVSLKCSLETAVETREKVFRRINLLLRSRVGLVVGSGASSWNELYHPRALVKMLSVAFDIPQEVALLAITDIPRQIVIRKLPVTTY